MNLLRAQVGDPIHTPRGAGLVEAIQGAPGSEVVTVRIGEVAVDFARGEIQLEAPVGIAEVEAFLGDPLDVVAAIEAFLDDPLARAARQPPQGGRSRGATMIHCSCACGACMRLSTAPDVHQPITGSCRCETRECPCA